MSAPRSKKVPLPATAEKPAVLERSATITVEVTSARLDNGIWWLSIFGVTEAFCAGCVVTRKEWVPMNVGKRAAQGGEDGLWRYVARCPFGHEFSVNETSWHGRAL